MNDQPRGPLSSKLDLQFVLLTMVRLVLAAALTFPLRSALAASAISVDRTDDPAVTAAGSGAAACTAAANDCSLRGAVLFANANPGTTIHISAGTYHLTIDGNSEGGNCGDATIGDLDIAGNDTSIAGASPASTFIVQTMPNDRVICVDQALAGNFTFSLSGVTLSGGRETHGVGGGGMISGAPGDVTTVTNVIFSNNQASGSGSPIGGGIANGEGTLAISGSIFIANQSAGSGGGVYYSANGGAGSFTVAGSTFTNNLSTGGDGGAIKTTSSTAPYAIHSSKFTGNKAQGPGATGGAVANESGTLTIDHSTFINNQVTASDGRGGAVGSVDGAGQDVTITLSRFVNNKAATAANGKVLYGGSGSVMTANDNWWGVNTGPAANDLAGAATVSSYLRLSAAANPNPIRVTQATSLTASFLKDSANASIPAGDLSVLVGLPISWGSAAKGTLSNLQVTVEPNGKATATFTADAAGAGSTSATVDNGSATVIITIGDETVFIPAIRK